MIKKKVFRSILNLQRTLYIQNQMVTYMSHVVLYVFRHDHMKSTMIATNNQIKHHMSIFKDEHKK